MIFLGQLPPFSFIVYFHVAQNKKQATYHNLSEHALTITIRCIISYTDSCAPSTTGNIAANLADTVYA